MDKRCLACLQGHPPRGFFQIPHTGYAGSRLCYDAGLQMFAGDVVRSMRSRANRFGVVNTLTVEEWLELLYSSNGRCHYCGQTFALEQMAIEHLIPLSRGGANAAYNVRPACGHCNSTKGSKTEAEYRSTLPVSCYTTRA